MSIQSTIWHHSVKLCMTAICCILCTQSFAFQKVYENSIDQGESVGMSIIAAADNPSETVMAGTTTGNSYNKDLISLTKVDQNGNVLWSYFYDSPDAANIRCMAIEYGFGGGYVLTGYYEHVNTGNYIGYVMEVNSAGGVMWRKNYEGLSAGLTLLKTSNGSYLVGGLLSDDLNEVTISRAGVVIKLNPIGNVQWHRLMNSTGLNNNPESDFDFVETIVELDDNNYFIAGGVNAVYTDGLTALQYVTEKIFAAKIDDSGSLLWNSSFGNKSGNPGNDGFHKELQIAADARYDPISKTIYLLANNGTFDNSESLQSVYQLDEATGSISTLAEFKHPTVGIPPKGSPEGFHCNQLRLDGNDIWLYGYVSTYVDEFACTTEKVYWPFHFKFDKNAPNSNTFTVYKTHNQGYAQAWIGFLEVYHVAGFGGESVPRVHSPEMALAREDGGTEYHTLLGYGHSVDVELYDDHYGAPICTEDITDLGTVSELEIKPISIDWNYAPRIYNDFYIGTYAANPDDEDCTPFVCTMSQPMATGIDQEDLESTFLEVYPNPSSGMFNVTYAQEISTDAQIAVVDLLGKEVLVTDLKESNVVDLSDLPNSPYMLRLYNQGNYQYQTLVKQ